MRGLGPWWGGLTAVCLWLVGCAAQGELPDPGLGQAADGIRSEAIRRHIEFLADDDREGRGTGSPGYLAAAEYVAGQFRELGLEPSARDGGFFQSVPLASAQRVPEGGALIVVRGERREELENGIDYLLRGDLLREHVSLTAPLVFAGYGVTAEEPAYDDYRSLEVEGKIVLALSGAPEGFPADLRAFHASRLSKQRNAAQRGALGLIELRTSSDRRAMDWERVAHLARLPSMRWIGEGGMLRDVVPELRVDGLLSERGQARLLQGERFNVEELADAAGRGELAGFDLAAELEVRTRNHLARLESPNVVASLRGSDPVLADEYVVVTAHLDHLGMGVAENGDAIYNGAYDNASGIAVMLEIAASLSALPDAPRRSVVFVALTGAERGLLGSDYFVRHPPWPVERMVANVNIDTALMLEPLQAIVASGAGHSTLADIVARVATERGLRVAPDPMPDRLGFAASDGFSFVRAGIPSVWLMPGPGDALTEWMRTTHHSPADDTSQPMDLEAGAEFARATLALVWRVAEADERPAWHAGDFFAGGFVE